MVVRVFWLAEVGEEGVGQAASLPFGRLGTVDQGANEQAGSGAAKRETAGSEMASWRLD
jgi:hypothetical protein